jgi:hypothetical protein
MTTTFTVTSSSGYYSISNNGINLGNNPPLTLLRGTTYTFSLNVSGHPFRIQTTIGAYDPNTQYTTGITNSGAESGNLVFVVPANAPNTLYYICEYHPAMNGVINITDAPVVCYAKGTLILTNQGYVPIQHIKEGNKIVIKGEINNYTNINPTANTEIKDVLWISSYKVNALNLESRPICIKKNAFGENYPFEDLYVSPNHLIVININNVINMIRSKNLVNGTTIYQDMECDEVEYYHLECETHSAIFANGLLAESYSDLNNRSVFTDNTPPAIK